MSKVWVVMPQGLKEIDCPHTIEDMLVALGMVESMSEARRKIKEKAVKTRDLWCHEDWKLVTAKQIITSDYLILRVGKATFGKHLQFIVIPETGQTFKGTERILREDWCLDIHMLDKFRLGPKELLEEILVDLQNEITEIEDSKLNFFNNLISKIEKISGKLRDPAFYIKK